MFKIRGPSHLQWQDCNVHGSKYWLVIAEKKEPMYAKMMLHLLCLWAWPSASENQYEGVDSTLPMWAEHGQYQLQSDLPVVVNGHFVLV